MPKRKGAKSFMTLSNAECANASKILLENSNSLLNSAITLASGSSYGHATSLLILSTEERMKALVLHLDSQGFSFRNNVKGISNLFSNHSLRYLLALGLSILYLLVDDLKKMVQIVRENPQFPSELINNKELIEKKNI